VVSQHSENDVGARALRRGRQLEMATLSWNVAGVIILAIAAVGARSVALAGFGLDSVIEIGASTVVLWELAQVAQTRQRKALRLIGSSFVVLAIYLAAQSTIVLAIGFRPHHSSLGIAWTAMTAAVMFALALGKKKIGTSLDNPVLKAEGRVTLIDAILATAVLAGLTFNALLGWWWADPVTGYVILYYALREARASLKS
jgi:divalent metal cation (Fe/Co/Zn/Cd) transporter